jgi:hypothetical protein
MIAVSIRGVEERGSGWQRIEFKVRINDDGICFYWNQR